MYLLKIQLLFPMQKNLTLANNLAIDALKKILKNKNKYRYNVHIIKY